MQSAAGRAFLGGVVPGGSASTGSTATPGKASLIQISSLPFVDPGPYRSGGRTPTNAAIAGAQNFDVPTTVDQNGSLDGPVTHHYFRIFAEAQAYFDKLNKPLFADSDTVPLDIKALGTGKASKSGATIVFDENAKRSSSAFAGFSYNEKATVRAAQGSSPVVSDKQLRAVLPKLSEAAASQIAGALSEVMRSRGINTPQREAAFLAQLAFESRRFTHLTEDPILGKESNLHVTGKEPITAANAFEYFEHWYGNRPQALGNTQPGDGYRYRGRGYIQLTGKSNFTQAGKDLGIDLVNHPELAAQPDNAVRIAGWYWKQKGLNELADQGNVREITHRVNGGYNGLSERQRYYQQFLNQLQQQSDMP